MPLYEYACGSCLQRFERLVRAAGREEVVCSKCGSANVRKAVSTFAAIGSGGSELGMASGGGGGCCGGGGGGCACSR